MNLRRLAADGPVFRPDDTVCVKTITRLYLLV